MTTPRFVRFHSTAVNQRGTLTGVFGLVNGLSRDGKLTPNQEQFRRTSNDWYDANFTNPTQVDPTVYDHPGARAWFKSTADELIGRVDGYLVILDAHGVGCEKVSSSDPGAIIYEDEHQVVVVPYRNG